MTQRTIFRVLASTALLIVAGLVPKSTAQCPDGADDACVTGHTTVPGQSGDVDYEIHAKESGVNKFKVTVKLKGGKKGFPAKKFYICMMFQLMDNGDDDREEHPSHIPPRSPRPKQERWDLDTVDCKIANPGPKSSTWKPVIDGKCWCCKKHDPPDVAERMAYHLGCKQIDLRTTGGGEIKPFDGVEVEFKNLLHKVTAADIESFYWDTFEGGVDGEDGVKPWCKDCKSAKDPNVPDALADPSDACPGVTGQDKAMGPSDWLGRIGGVTNPRIGRHGPSGVNIWAGSFRSIVQVLEFPCTISRGQPAEHGEPKTIERGPQPVKEVKERCEKLRCDGKNNHCWVGSAPLDNFWTMRWKGDYPARLEGTFNGPSNSTVSVIVPGQVQHEYETGPTGKVEINESYRITPDSTRTENDFQMMVVSSQPLPAGKEMRFDGDVRAGEGNPGWQPGELMHKMSFTGPPVEQQPESDHRLPEGAIFATADVEPDHTIEVQESGYALIATAEVVSVKRVNPGDRLDPKTTKSIQFDSGTGMLIRLVEKLEIPLEATVGLIPLLTEDHSKPLPVYNGGTTMYVGSDQSFQNAAISIDNTNKIPAKVHAVILNQSGKKVGELSSFSGLQLRSGSQIAIRTLDSSGATLKEGQNTGGVLDGTPQVSFSKLDYKPGETGKLLIGNQENYLKLAEMTKFGSTDALRNEVIRIVPLSDVEGLPPTAPFGTTSLTFRAVHPGQARVALYFPRAVPPKQVSNPGDNEALKQANAAVSDWLNLFR